MHKDRWCAESTRSCNFRLESPWPLSAASKSPNLDLITHIYSHPMHLIVLSLSSSSFIIILITINYSHQHFLFPSSPINGHPAYTLTYPYQISPLYLSSIFPFFSVCFNPCTYPSIGHVHAVITRTFFLLYVHQVWEFLYLFSFLFFVIKYLLQQYASSLTTFCTDICFPSPSFLLFFSWLLSDLKESPPPAVSPSSSSRLTFSMYPFPSVFPSTYKQKDTNTLKYYQVWTHCFFLKRPIHVSIISLWHANIKSSDWKTTRYAQNMRIRSWEKDSSAT